MHSVPSEEDATRAAFALLSQALIYIRAIAGGPEQPAEVPSIQELANLFHVVPHQLLALQDASLRTASDPATATDVLRRIAFYARQNPRLALWVRYRMDEQGFDSGALSGV